MKWLDVFNQNYYGKSMQAKELATFLKENYNGAKYLPWATLERMMYQQDPDAVVEIIKSETGTYTTTHSEMLITSQEKGEDILKTRADMFVHTVEIRAKFLGKVIQEVYPVQDNKYKAPKIIDANLVNKAIQRAKAKAISRVTGLGLSLYETGDLQFEEDKEPLIEKKSQTAPKNKEASVETAPKVAQTPTKPEINLSKEILDIVNEIKLNDSFDKGLQIVNPAVLKKYGFTLSREDEGLAEKLNKIENLHIFMRTLKKQSGIPVE